MYGFNDSRWGTKPFVNKDKSKLDVVQQSCSQTINLKIENLNLDPNLDHEPTVYIK